MLIVEKEPTKAKAVTFTDLLGGENMIAMLMHSGFDLITLSHEGITKASLEVLIAHVGISKKDFIENILNLSVKAIERKKSDDKLDRRTSSHIIEIAKVVEHAFSAFEEKEKVQRWLNTLNSALNNLKPLDFFDMPTGLNMVDQVLGRIEEGVFFLMTVYRIVKAEKRARDLSGTGAFKYGGRWNSVGTYMLYSSENISLAYLEMLVHAEEDLLPSDLFVSTILIKDEALIHSVKDNEYPSNWKKLDSLENKAIGNQWMAETKYLGFKVRSAVNPLETNYLLNPLFPKYSDLVEVVAVAPLIIDSRLIK